MNFNEYMQLEIDCGLEETIINFKNIVQLDGEYEVALVDIMYDYAPFTLKNLSVNKNSVKKENIDYKFTIHIPEEGIVEEKRRSSFLSGDYNTTPRAQLSEFDIWNYQISNVNRGTTTININNVNKSIGEKDLDIVGVVNLLNEGIESSEHNINTVLTSMFRGTQGEDKVTTDRYFELPKFVIDENRNIIYFYLPYYVYSVELSEWLANITQLKRVVKKKYIPLPYTPLLNMAEDYRMVDPKRKVTCNLKTVDTHYRQDGLNVFVYCDLIEYQTVGHITSPLLRLVSLDRSKTGINWR